MPGNAIAQSYSVTVEKIAALAGPEAPVDMKGPDICGTDIGTIAEFKRRMVFAFGDTLASMPAIARAADPTGARTS